MALTVKETQAQALQMFESEVNQADKEVLNKIEALLREVTGRGVSGKDFRMYTEDELSRIAGSMATLKVNLGEIMARADASYRMNEEEIRIKMVGMRDAAMQKYTAEGKKYTQGDLNDYAEKHLFLYRALSVYKERHAKVVQNLWWSLKLLLEVMLKRIDVLQNQRSDSGASKNGSLEYDIPQS